MKLGPVSPAVRVESLDQEGRGVAHLDGKVIFIEGALTGETVEYVSFQRKPSYELAEAKRIIRASVSRVEPRCSYFGVCGGCSMQHLEPRAQVAAKQRVLEDNLARIGKVTPETILSPIHGPTWQYRYRARFSARHVAKKGTLVGFRERGGNGTGTTTPGTGGAPNTGTHSWNGRSGNDRSYTPRTPSTTPTTGTAPTSTRNYGGYRQQPATTAPAAPRQQTAAPTRTASAGGRSWGGR